MASFWWLYFNFEHISHLCPSVSIVNFEQENAGWDYHLSFYHPRKKIQAKFEKFPSANESVRKLSP